jgi:hypothetical protein
MRSRRPPEITPPPAPLDGTRPFARKAKLTDQIDPSVWALARVQEAANPSAWDKRKGYGMGPVALRGAGGMGAGVDPGQGEQIAALQPGPAHNLQNTIKSLRINSR